MIDPHDSVTQSLSITPAGSSIRMQFQSHNRVYTAILMQNLFGEWVIAQAWGGRFNRRGGHMTRPVESHEAGVALLLKLAKQRQARGYQKV
jgi:predicted DNA-binding WGR domain protein